MGAPERKIEDQTSNPMLASVKVDVGPGYLGIFFGTWFFATILCVAASFWPVITGITSVLIMIGAAGTAFKRGQTWRARVQFAMTGFAGLCGVLMAFSVGGESKKEVPTSTVVQTPQQAVVQVVPHVNSSVPIENPPPQSNPVADAYSSEAGGSDWFIVDPVDGRGTVIRAANRPKVAREYREPKGPKGEPRYRSIDDPPAAKPEPGSLGLMVISATDLSITKKFERLSEQAQYVNLGFDEQVKKLASSLKISPSRLRELVTSSSLIESALGDGRIIDKRPGGASAVTEQTVKAKLGSTGLGLNAQSVTLNYRGQSEGYFCKVVLRVEAGDRAIAALSLKESLRALVLAPELAAIQVISIYVEVPLAAADEKTTFLAILDISRQAAVDLASGDFARETFLAEAADRGKLVLHPTIREGQ